MTNSSLNGCAGTQRFLSSAAAAFGFGFGFGSGSLLGFLLGSLLLLGGFLLGSLLLGSLLLLGGFLFGSLLGSLLLFMRFTFGPFLAASFSTTTEVHGRVLIQSIFQLF